MTGWVLPCEIEGTLTAEHGTVSTDIEIEPHQEGTKCVCGKCCTPIKVRVTVERVQP